MIEDGNSGGTSKDILTWKQVQADEKPSILFAALEPVYEQLKCIRAKGQDEKFVDGCKISMYEVHDGKMIYSITDHSKWNRKHHPFLLCKCARGQGVINEDHECEFITPKDSNYYWERSMRRWNNTRKKRGEKGEEYTRKQHLDWIDQWNYGVSHFGFSESLLPRSSIRFDVFHLGCGISRRLMSYVRVFILGSTSVLIE